MHSAGPHRKQRLLEHADVVREADGSFTATRCSTVSRAAGLTSSDLLQSAPLPNLGAAADASCR